MTELDGWLSDARVRLTALQQEARAGHRAKVLLGVIELGSDLLRYAAEKTAEQIRGAK